VDVIQNFPKVLQANERFKVKSYAPSLADRPGETPSLHKMRSTEIFVFHGCKYRVTISDRQALPNNKLRQKIYRKRRTITSSAASFTASVGLSFATFGVSLIGCALSARACIVAGKKLDLLEAEWEARGQRRLPTRVFKDFLLPACLAQAVGCIADDAFDGDNGTSVVVDQGDGDMKEAAGSVFEVDTDAPSDPPEYEEVGADSNSVNADIGGDAGDSNSINTIVDGDSNNVNGDNESPTDPLVDVSVPDDTDVSSVPIDSQPADGAPDLSGQDAAPVDASDIVETPTQDGTPPTDITSESSAPTAPDSQSQLSQMAHGFTSGTESLLTTGALPANSALAPAAVVVGEALAFHAAHRAVEEVLHFGAHQVVKTLSDQGDVPPPPKV